MSVCRLILQRKSLRSMSISVLIKERGMFRITYEDKGYFDTEEKKWVEERRDVELVDAEEVTREEAKNDSFFLFFKPNKDKPFLMIKSYDVERIEEYDE